jgi:hypothetical protein
MKNKFIVTIIAIVALVFSASAQSHKSQSLVAGGTITLAASATTNLPVATHGAGGLWVTADGTTANAAIMLSIVGTNANATNIVTLTAYTVPDGSKTATSAQNKFEFTLTGNGTTAATIVTNLPSSLLQGSKAIRVTTIATSASANGGGSLTITPKLVGFVP